MKKFRIADPGTIRGREIDGTPVHELAWALYEARRWMSRDNTAALPVIGSIRRAFVEGSPADRGYESAALQAESVLVHIMNWRGGPATAARKVIHRYTRAEAWRHLTPEQRAKAFIASEVTFKEDAR